MDVSSYLSAIQSLKGETPGQKYKELHSIARNIIESNEEREAFVKTGETNLVPSVLQPTMRILVGLKLKSKDAVVEALKSDDVSVIKLALGAKWFFSASNDLISVQYFAEKVWPFVSLRTRLELIKALSKCLQASQAESFHKELVTQFGTDQALPVLIACGEDYIYEEILKSKILLSERVLKDLYHKYPRLVLRYLRLIKDNKVIKWNRTHISDIGIGPYEGFLPNLVKNHTQEFTEFLLSIPHASIELGNTRAEYLLRSAAETVVQNPDVFLDKLPLKLVRSKLTKHQYDTMLENLFPADVDKLSIHTIVSVVKKYYPKEGGFELFRANYEKVYGKDLLEQKDLMADTIIYEILPADIKAELSRKFVNSFTDKSQYLKKVQQLPPAEAIPLLKEQIKKSSVLSREECLMCMLRSCSLYESKADLLRVLHYYNSRHKNEQAQVLRPWLECLTGLFDMKSLDKEHWQVFKDIVLRAYVKGHFFVNQGWFNAGPLFNPMLQYFFTQCNTGKAEEADKVFLDKFVNIILEYNCENYERWDFLEDLPREIEEACIEKFLVAMPEKYPENHAIWKKQNNKLLTTTYFIEKLGQFNQKNMHAPLDPKVKATKMLIQYYPWLAKFATEVTTNKEDSRKSRLFSNFIKSLQKYFPEFYQNIIDEHSDMINDVTANDALVVLKRDRSKISAKINQYVTACQNELEKGGKCTRHFVMSLKWYQDIPVRFVEKCLAEIEKEGSILILGILLDGKALSKITEPYLPKESDLEIDSENAKKDYNLVSSIPRALNYANPPPALGALVSLCKGDYLSVALQTLCSIAQRTPIDSVLSFATHLTNSAISVKKAGIRLVFQVAPKPQLRAFLAKVCKESNPGIREVAAKMVCNVFTQTPSQDSWQLMREVIHDLLPDDKNIYDVLKKLKSVHEDYATDYIMEIIQKIDSFKDEELSEKERSELICSFLSEIDDSRVFNNLPETVITKITKKYLFDCTMNFIFDIYLFSDEQTFEDRLKVFVEILSEQLSQMYNADPKHPRSYPLMRKIHDQLVVYDLFNNLQKHENKEMHRRFIASVLKLTSIQKDLEMFITFHIYQIILDASDAKSFGEKCAKNIDDLIELYNNQLIIEYYGKYLQRILYRSSYKDQHFDVIDGLMSHKFNYGVLIGIKLLSPWITEDYGEEYDKFVQAAKNSDDLMIQAVMDDYLRSLLFF